EVLLDTDIAATGRLEFPVEAGFTLFIGIDDDGFTPSLSDNPDATSDLRISNFSFTPPESPLTLDNFETCWGVVNAEDKTPPAVVTTPEDEVLPCTDFEEIMLTMLDVNISRCWIVERDAQGVFRTVPGTMATALRDRLDLVAFDPGAGTAIVPEFSDGCAPRLQVCVNDVATFDEEDPECNDVVITRTFTATELDNCENAAGEENGPAVTS
ncbi:hypothetical protein, partial [Lewinella sp. W8]|uniref:hypothetical protein n=1 Tax=Lewinella sp. W8 TaxID=2528208 RepID=UPI0015630E98